MNRAVHIVIRACAMAIFFAMALSCHALNAPTENLRPDTLKKRDLTVSLITCYPGEEIYELCGHSAVRVRGDGIDSVWNYGIFDFSQPNFVYRFVKGETDYRGASYPFAWFMPEYISTGRKVVEQDINFTPEEAEKMLEVLRESVRPENAVYRYNYIKDNCSTRILNLVDSAAGNQIIYPDSVRYGTFRNEMRAYHENYPWYQFGIDVALGSGLDEKINSRQEMFVPVELMRNAESGRFADGRDFIKAQRVLNDGRDDVVEEPTPWILSPIFWAWMIALASAFIIFRDISSERIFIPYYAVWFFILGLAGCLVAFLVWVSEHESTSPNILIFWLNPFQFLFVAAMFIKPLRILAIIMSYYNILASACLLVLSPIYSQSFNPAFYPLLLVTLGLAAAYAIITYKLSYKIR